MSFPYNVTATGNPADTQRQFGQSSSQHSSSLEHESEPLLPSLHGHHTDRLDKIDSIREIFRHFLLSKYAHYLVIILVALDVAGLFAGFLISLHICEHTCGRKAVDDRINIVFWEDTKQGLSIVSLILSSLFMIELLCSIFAFGLRFFKSLFHIIDTFSIVASFLVDAIGQGTVAEAGSLIIVLRLFRVFKIIEEGSTAAEELQAGLQDRFQMLEQENHDLRQRLLHLSRNGGSALSPTD